VGAAAYLIRLKQTHTDLNTAPLPIRYTVEAPLQVYIQQIYEMLTSFWIHTFNTMYHLSCR